jgi:hypothetical protein
MDVARDLVARLQADPKLAIASGVIGFLVVLIIFVLGRKSNASKASSDEPKSTSTDTAAPKKVKAKKTDKKEADVCFCLCAWASNIHFIRWR